jgi:hypothetical protein
MDPPAHSVSSSYPFEGDAGVVDVSTLDSLVESAIAHLQAKTMHRSQGKTHLEQVDFSANVEVARMNRLLFGSWVMWVLLLGTLESWGWLHSAAALPECR